ncbi:HNH endonuclease [Pedobacter sp. SYP-B3415]|uniref:HNH endonuclease n=1 Tax=Pedobacter sp. SYP-B3415 TaxID=2496641 RepID=UPI00101C723B|nr:HNH endonuclease [Pedobacter sp. SYP-B3415]
MTTPRYKFYATLLDAYSWYLQSEQDNAFQEFIDKLNRVPFVSEAADRGTAFNELVDYLIERFGIEDQLPSDPNIYKQTIRKKEVYTYHYTSREGVQYIFDFPVDIVDKFVVTYAAAVPQLRVSAILPTIFGPVEIYGNLDELIEDTIADIKTTKSYTFPKYLNNAQHLVYPYCFHSEGLDIKTFRYHATDFSNIYVEEYIFNPDRDIPRLQRWVEDLIRFVNQHRALITDTKIFALDEPDSVPV